jgi:hypothetical protein
VRVCHVGHRINTVGGMDWNSIGVGPAWKIPELAQLQDLEQNVNGFIISYLAVNPICTLSDLNKALIAERVILPYPSKTTHVTPRFAN